MRTSLLLVALVANLWAAPLSAQTPEDPVAALARLNAILNDAARPTGLPAHEFLPACYSDGHGRYWIWTMPVRFDHWPNSIVIPGTVYDPVTHREVSTGTVSGTYEPEELKFGTEVQASVNGIPQSWGGLRQPDYAWVRFYSGAWYMWEGGWRPTAVPQNTTVFVSGPGVYNVGGTFIWGPLSGLGFPGRQVTEWKQVRCQ